jgi:hypothetical protein
MKQPCSVTHCSQSLWSDQRASASLRLNSLWAHIAVMIAVARCLRLFSIQCVSIDLELAVNNIPSVAILCSCSRPYSDTLYYCEIHLIDGTSTWFHDMSWHGIKRGAKERILAP